MELAVHETDGGELEVEFVGERSTVLTLLKERLLEDDQVDLATVLTDHPVLSNPHLVVRASDGKPQAAVKRAAASLRKDLDALEDALIKALK